MKIGLIGLGRMGLAMASRLMANGFPNIWVWDRSAPRVQAAVDAGASAGLSARAVVERCETILVVINDDAGARRLYGGEDGMLSGDVSGKLFIEMSTLQPATVRALAEQVECRGARLIGAPLMGSIPTVREGGLYIPAGGHPEDLERARPVLDVLARAVKRVGPAGAGNALKLAVNLTMGAYLQALAEGLALGMAEGLSIDDMLEVLGQAPTANGWLASKTGVLTGGASATTLDIASLRKDILGAVATGASAGVPMAMGASIVSSLTAAVANGLGGEDLAQLPKFYRDNLVQKPA